MSKTDPVGEQRVSDETLRQILNWKQESTPEHSMAREIITLRSQSAAAAEETRFNDGVDRCVAWMEEQGRWLNGTTSALSRTGQHDIAKANEIKADRYFRDANQMRSLKRLPAPAAAVEPKDEAHAYQEEPQ